MIVVSLRDDFDFGGYVLPKSLSSKTYNNKDQKPDKFVLFAQR